MRKSIKEFIEICARTLPTPEPIYEFGSLQVDSQRGFADLRPLFPGKQYVGCDFRQGRGVDRILDLHDIDMPGASVGSVLCIDTLEHVEFPRKAIAEIHRILGPGGLVVLTSSMYFPIHDHPHDYWRFTPDGFRSLLRDFEYSLVESAGKEDFPALVVGVTVKGGMPEQAAARFTTELKRWKERWSRPGA